MPVSSDQWRSVWFDPVGQRLRTFFGAADADGITQLSTDDAPWLRWTYRTINASGFHWFGEASDDGRRALGLDDDMVATKVTPRPAGSRIR
jgi:hypothetical protein